MPALRAASLFFFFWALSACQPLIVPAGPKVGEAAIVETPIGDLRYLAADGEKIVLRDWPAKGETKAVVLALHGFGDHARFVEEAAKVWAEEGVTTYAYDQRGFGTSASWRRWAGTDSYVEDARQMLHLLAARHPGKPLYLLGESMGGAVALLAAQEPGLELAGVILSAPAIWSRDLMPGWQRLGLALISYSFPYLDATTDAVQYQSSDNIEVLRQMAADPLVLHKPRIDMLHGLTDLMDAAVAAGPPPFPSLWLYGERDQLVPAHATKAFWARLAPDSISTTALYPEGWHLLLRDLKAEEVVLDVLHWIEEPQAPLPSGADQRAAKWFQQ